MSDEPPTGAGDDEPEFGSTTPVEVALIPGQRRRLGYYVNLPSGQVSSTVSAVTLTDFELKVIDDTLRVVIEIQPIVFAYEILQMAHSEFHNGIAMINKSLAAMLPGWAGAPRLMHDAHITVQHRIISFLSASRLFLDHIETALKRQYGSSSSQVEYFKSQAANLFDNHFAYRFMSKLRNMAQHVSVPVTNFAMTGGLNPDHQIHEFSFQFSFNKEKLLQSWSDWGKPVLADFADMQGNIPATPIIDEYFSLLKQLCRTVLQIRALELLNLDQLLQTIMSAFDETPPGLVPVIWIGDPHPGGPPKNMDVLPFEEWRRIAEIMSGQT